MTDVLGTLNVSEATLFDSTGMTADKITTLGGNVVIKGDLDT